MNISSNLENNNEQAFPKKKGVKKRVQQRYGTTTINPKAALMEIRKISFLTFYWLKLKMFILRRKDRLLKIIDKMEDFHKNILNETSIYKLYIENEKLKLFLFNEDQRMAFEHIKLNYKTIFLTKAKDLDLKKLSLKLKQSDTRLDHNLLSYIDKKQ